MKLIATRQRIIGIGLFLVLFALLVPAVFAQESRGGDTVVVEAGEVVPDDLYVGGERIIINGTIEGDLVAMGQDVIINGTVEGDVLVLAQSISIQGEVQDDVRVMVFLVALGREGVVGDDLVGGGYSLETAVGSQVNGGIAFFGFQALLDGNVAGDVRFAGNSLEINGAVGGDVNATVGSEQDTGPGPFLFMPQMPKTAVIPPGLTVGKEASIGGDLTYQAPESASIPARAVSGQTNYEQVTQPEQERPEESAGQKAFSASWSALQKWVTLIIIGFVLLKITPLLVPNLAGILGEKLWPSLGWGAVWYFGIPLLAFVLAGAALFLMFLFGLIKLGTISLAVGLIVGAILVVVFVALFLIFLYLTKIVVGYALGLWILRKLNSGLAEKPIWPLALGTLIVIILITLPYVGALISLIIAMLGLGTLWLNRQALPAPMEKTA
ncbi:MAG TPA: hypothetical protein ENK32_03390 [Anaerolineae bacterium]|nr:hypothetical protein [Anaerolineae bacterium]